MKKEKPAENQQVIFVCCGTYWTRTSDYRDQYRDFHPSEIQPVVIPIFFVFPWFCAVFAPIFQTRNDSAYICYSVCCVG